MLQLYFNVKGCHKVMVSIRVRFRVRHLVAKVRVRGSPMHYVNECPHNDSQCERLCLCVPVPMCVLKSLLKAHNGNDIVLQMR